MEINYVSIKKKKKCCSCRSQETQFKIIHKLQTTLYQRSKYDKNCSPFCKHCKKRVGTYVHLMWLCPKIQLYWEKICKDVSRVVKTNVRPCPLQCIQGLPFVNPKFKRYSKLLSILFYNVRLTILQDRLNETIPTDLDWLNNVLQILPLERLTHVLKGNTNTFFEIWKPLMDFIGEDAAKTILKGFVLLRV